MFSELQKQKVMHLFNVLDVNKNGRLQLDDFVHVAEEIIHQLDLDPESRAAKLITIKANRLFVQFLIDTENPDLSIDLWDWLKFFERELSRPEKSGLLHHFIHRTNYHVFALFDLNNDRYISPDEYKNMWSIYNINGMDSRESFDGLDKNGDSFISVDELIHGLEEFFYSQKTSAPGNKIFGKWA